MADTAAPLIFNAPEEASSSRPTIFSIAPSKPFLHELAATLLADFAPTPLELADILILLPTRRAVRKLREAFAEQATNEGTTLLPRIQTIGDLGDTQISFIPEIAAIERGLAPEISPLRRRLELARLVHAYLQHEGKSTRLEPGWNKALDLADALSALLDSFYTEEIDPTTLKNLVKGPRALHWEKSALFLDIVVTQWPLILREFGVLDPADRRRRLIDGLAQNWDQSQGGSPPDHPVLIAGSTGSIPSVARLIKIVSMMPKGAVILPGLDTKLDATAWTSIDDPHPQSGLKHLLDRYFDELERASIKPWPCVPKAPGNACTRAASSQSARESLISLALRPMEATGDWLAPLKAFQTQPDTDRAIDGLYLDEAENENDEATHIALLMREILEMPDKSCALVTHDRMLGRRVALKLRRWGINLDDSAGLPFASTLRGNFLRLCAAWLKDVSDPVALMSILKHPLSNLGFDRQTFSRMVYALDLALRGVSPGMGFSGLRRSLLYRDNWDKPDLGKTASGDSAMADSASAPSEPDGHELDTIAKSSGRSDNPREDKIGHTFYNADEMHVFAPLIDRLEEIATPFETLANEDKQARVAQPRKAGTGTELNNHEATEPSSIIADFSALLKAHIKAAELIAATPDDKTGQKTLWSHADGEMAAHIVSDLYTNIETISHIKTRSYLDLFQSLIEGHAVRGGYTHPRLAVLGPFEARLVSVDRMILGGLNEGSWPSEPAHNPFISRPMRREIGLSSFERRIGLAAHDFAQLASQSEVFLTRAKQVARAPSTPSRWIIRLKNILTATKQLETVDISQNLADWARYLDQYKYQGPVAAPRPTPPIEARPARISVTGFEKLMRDPYAIYAKDILRLRPLDAIGADMTSAQRGRFIHGVFAAFTHRYGLSLPDDIPVALFAIADELMQRFDMRPSERGYLTPLLEESFTWFDGFSRAAAREAKPVIIEQSGAWEVNGVKHPVTLMARSDRIDLVLPNAEKDAGKAILYDYKSGLLPSFQEMATFSPQLALTALILQNGGFRKVGAVEVAQISYLRALNRAHAKNLEISQTGAELISTLEATHRRVIELLDIMYHPQTPYLSQPRPKYKDNYGDYDHLARRNEWATMAEDNAGDAL